MLGWRSILQLLARRAAESIAFSVPDRHALWSRAEDDILVQAVAKHTRLLLIFFLAVRDRLHQICPGAYRNSAKSDADSMILCHN